MTHTSTEQPELLPCPFCGCKPKLVGAGLIRWIKCPEDSECGSSGMAMGIAANDLGRGIAAWNRRAPVSQARAQLSPYQVREIIKKLNANHDEEGWSLGDFTREVEAAHGITQEKQG